MTILLDVVLSHEGVNGTVVGQVLDSLVDVVLELGIALVDAYSSPVLICLMVWQVLNCSAVSWLATERLVTTASPLSDCKALKHSVASL